MNDLEIKMQEIFNPNYLKQSNELRKRNGRLVQYTSATSAMSIIKNKEVWLRNTQCMNDYREVNHGLDCLVKAYKSKSGQNLKVILNSLFPDSINEFEHTFDGMIPDIKSHSYIACFSEHEDIEDNMGRLSMWRAYGGDCPVALVLNNAPFLNESDAFKAYTVPVEYLDEKEYGDEFDKLVARIDSDRDFFKESGMENFYTYFLGYCILSSIGTKHPGFKEEKEWRVVYLPKSGSSDYIKAGVELVGSVPQEIYKIPLKNIPDKNFNGATIPEILDRIIIGPTDHQGVLYQAFVSLLKEAGCGEDIVHRVVASGIPLRV